MRQFTPPNDAEGTRAGHGEGGSTSAALLIAQYVSIIALFGAATAGIVKLTEKGNRRKRDEAMAAIEAEIVP